MSSSQHLVEARTDPQVWTPPRSANAEITRVLAVAAQSLGSPILVSRDTGGGVLVVEWFNHAMEDALHRSIEPGALLNEVVDLARLDLRVERTVTQNFQLRTPAGMISVAGRSIPVDCEDVGSRYWVVLLTGEVALSNAQLRASESKFTALVERAPVPTMLSEAGLRLGHVNDAFSRLVGVPAPSLLGTQWLQYIHEDDLDEVVEGAASALTGSEVELTARVRTVNQGERSVVVRLAPVQFPGEGAGFVGTLEDQTARRVFEEQLEYQALHDALTGLPNRSMFNASLHERVSMSAGSDAVVYVDLDDFKLVNDSFGHAVGDTFLCTIAQRLQKAAGRDGLVCRLGGDEFAVLAKCHSVEEASALATRVLEEIVEPVILSGTTIFPSGSVGVTLIDGTFRTSEEVLGDADAAMYAAKRAGKGRYVICDDDLRAAHGKILQRLTALREAIEGSDPTTSGTLEVLYQPIVDMRTGRFVAMEALSRWEHPTWGVISPVDFVPLAESHNLIRPLGEKVLSTACEAMAILRHKLGDRAPERVNVNVSVHQLGDVGLPLMVEEVLDRYGLPPEALCLEVTESAFLENRSVGISILTRLREMGVKIGIDDFGTGYSSLSYLQDLPVDALKVDKSFVTAIGSGDAREGVLKVVKVLADLFEMSIVAEGVETQEQASFLQDLGYDVAQGWLYAKASTLETVLNLLEIEA